MHLGKEKNFIMLTFDSTESRAMKRILASVSRNYKIAPAELDAKSAAAWYSTRGCETAKMSAEDTHEWIEELRQQRSARIQHLEEWLRQVSVRSTEPCRLKEIGRAHV